MDNRNFSVLLPTVIRIKEKITWKHAVYAVTQPLIDLACVPSHYPDTIIQDIEKLGAYCIVRPEIALIHGRILENTTRSGVQIMIAKPPVLFPAHFHGAEKAQGSKKRSALESEDSLPVTVFIAICAPDAKQYMDLIARLSPLLRGDHLAKRMSQWSDEQILQHFSLLKDKRKG